ncbi:glycosyltransferase family 4 protein [Azotobacter chroococcum]|uniref:glycosyltransferase family 4 protein n=1 Tax=Azotobacter chroococcum TaxID=353 RepID=UPI001F60FB2D|nr:glycosyltransferase family 4 protein [Azotobacter chroococcum]
MSQVVRAMSGRGRVVEVLTSGHGNGFLSDLPGMRRKIFYRRSESKILTLLYYLISQVALFLFCLRYWREDVSFYVNTMMPFGAAFAAKLMGKPVIYHVHETSIRPALLKHFLRLAIDLTASKIIYVSNSLCQAEGFKKKSQFVVHNALDGGFGCPPVSYQGGSFIVLMICSLKKYKGVGEFFELAKLLLPQPAVRFKLVLNAEQAEIDDWFAGVAIPSNIELFPRQSSVSDFYSEASLLLNLSRPDEWVETFGLTILEGMAHGLPVIVPPVGGPAEIVTDGREGFLISCYETQKIAEIIQRLVNDPDTQLKLARNAYMHAKDFNLVGFEEKIAEIIDL